MSTPMPGGSGSGSLAPGDSISDTPYPRICQPIDRPKEYLETILWHYNDCKSDPAILKVNNSSRPVMKLAIRMKDSNLVTNEVWGAIKATTNEVKQSLLNGTKCRTKRYLIKHCQREWDAAVNKLEHDVPENSLCAAHWKAE